MHTSQAWADTFISELNDTHVEAELRQKRIPPQLQSNTMVSSFTNAKERLIILGYNATLTETIDPKRQTRSKLEKKRQRLHPIAHECLTRLCDDPNTTVCIFSGSERYKLSEIFAMLPKVWIAAENGVFIRPPLQGKNGTGSPRWMTMIETTNLDWLESVEVVFDYFCERTPRSHVEARETSLVWSYKNADPDFGRQQARDLLQHLWTGPISNAAVDVIQGAKSVEVRPVGLSKGTAVERIVQMIGGISKEVIEVDFVMCCGHFLGRDEDIFSFLELKSLPPSSAEYMSPQGTSPQHAVGSSHTVDEDEEGKHEIPIRFHDVFTCTVGRKRSAARYYVNDSDEVAQCLAALTNSLNDGKGLIELLQFEDSLSSGPSLSSSRNMSAQRIGSVTQIQEEPMSVRKSSSGQSI